MDDGSPLFFHARHPERSEGSMHYEKTHSVLDCHRRGRPHHLDRHAGMAALELEPEVNGVLVIIRVHQRLIVLTGN